MTGLAESQRWLQHAIVDPGHPATPAGHVLASSPGLSAGERLGIYRRGYRLRLLEAMRGLHPGLRALLGPELFDDFAAAYLDACPSRSRTLSELDRRFAGYLATQRPDRVLPPARREAWVAVVIDLARYERAFAGVYDGPGTEGLVPAAPGSAAPGSVAPGSWPWAGEGRAPAMAPCLRVLRLCAPVHSYCASVRSGQAPGPPQPRPVRLVLSRRDYVVTATELPVAAHRFLSALLAGCGARAAARRARLGAAEATGLLRNWASRGWTVPGNLAQPSPN
jgi:hypothetical protein